MKGPEDFLLRFGRAVTVEMALLDRAADEGLLTVHGRDLRETLRRIADRVAAEPSEPTTEGETHVI